MSASHTPGPWSLLETETSVDLDVGDGQRLSGWQDIGPEGGPVVAVSLAYDSRAYRDGVPEQEANARLIAAAPELLDTLGALLASHAQLVNCGDCGSWDVETEPEVIAARAAIAKATGQ